MTEVNDQDQVGALLPIRPTAGGLGPWIKHDLFRGHGSVHIWDLLGASQAPPFQAVLWCELEAGGAVGKHRQQEHPEIVIGLSGSGRISVDEQTYTFGPGVSVFLPLGSLLSINAATEGPLVYLIIKAREDGAEGGEAS